MEKNKKENNNVDRSIKENEKRKATKRNTNSKVKTKNKKKVMLTDYLLLGLFIVLLVLVVVLFGMVFKKEKEQKNKIKADLVIPVFEKGNSSGFTINVASLIKDNDYILKVTNTKNKKINSEELVYKITVENKSTAKIEVTKNDGVENLITNQEKTVLENQKLVKDKEHSVYYHIRVLEVAEVDDNDMIEVVIES